MVEAPEKIWAYETPVGDTGWLCDPTHGQAAGSTEYLRSDIAARQIAELRERANKAERQAEGQWAGWVKEEVARKAAEADKARLSEALRNLAHEMRFLLRSNPDKDGGLYRQRLDEAETVLKENCQHGCDAGGICLANVSGYPESCPAAPTATGGREP